MDNSHCLHPKEKTRLKSNTFFPGVSTKKITKQPSQLQNVSFATGPVI
jgi:hypothetical protein